MGDLEEEGPHFRTLRAMAAAVVGTLGVEVPTRVRVPAAEAVPIILELVKKIFPGLAVAMDLSVFTVPRGWLQPCPKLPF